MDSLSGHRVKRLVWPFQTESFIYDWASWGKCFILWRQSFRNKFKIEMSLKSFT